MKKLLMNFALVVILGLLLLMAGCSRKQKRGSIIRQLIFYF
ncbi:MAG: hypothetical protein WBC45_01195 [Atribacterota bacterium]